MSNWKPVDSAPKDGRPFAVRAHNGIEMVYEVSHWSSKLKRFVDTNYDFAYEVIYIPGAEWTELPE